jgi:chromosome segregation ATPase
VLPATAREYADELKAAEPLTAGALYADLQAEMAELKAENIRLTMASRQRETEVAFLADHVDELEKQIGNLDARRARLVRKAGEYHKSLWARRELFTVLDTAHNDTLRQLAKAEKIASESRAHVRALKTENRELRESLDAARAHVELLQKQIPVAAIIETREQPAPVEPPKTLPFDASQQTAATPESKG